MSFGFSDVPIGASESLPYATSRYGQTRPTAKARGGRRGVSTTAIFLSSSPAPLPSSTANEQQARTAGHANVTSRSLDKRWGRSRRRR
ncbi:hypothetical protein HPB50_018128 [Hyalomma asiaticum]|uniref:Uncharacterized protein n=1 Tax=Hyalomma asiaticum TaxID=266040 RepID=A0ACB7T5L5_HYAAI|nr:hypothetical protein HPB50_018128 [Hyalomma asiaticum]